MWELKVWGDGLGWLHVEDSDRPIYSEITIEQTQLEVLKDKLDAVLKHELTAHLGQRGMDGPRRLLEIDTGDEAARTLEIHTIFSEFLEDESERDRAIAVLELWGELRGLFDTEGTLDCRSYDRDCVEAGC